MLEINLSACLIFYCHNIDSCDNKLLTFNQRLNYIIYAHIQLQPKALVPRLR